MKNWSKICALGALLIVASVSARADVARPKDEHNKPANTTITMRIEPNYKATEAKLLIPRSMLQEIRAQLDGNDAQAATTSARFHSLGSAQTVMTGIFLIVIGITDSHHRATLFGLVAGMAFFHEAGNGANFALVPHVHPFANGKSASVSSLPTKATLANILYYERHSLWPHRRVR